MLGGVAECICHNLCVIRKETVMTGKKIKSIVASVIVIAIAIGAFCIKKSGVDPYEEASNKINSIVKSNTDNNNAGDIVEQYMKLEPDELTYTSDKKNVYDREHKPKKYVAPNIYYGESREQKEFAANIDIPVGEEVAKHDLDDWAYYEGAANKLGIYKKENMFNVGDTVFLRHSLTEFRINDMHIVSNLDEIDDKFINGDRKELEEIMAEAIHRNEYHHNYGIATTESGESQFKFLVVDITLSCKSPWPVCFPVAPRLCYLDDEGDHLEWINIVYDRFIMEDGLYYMNPSMYKEKDGDYYDWFMLGKGEEINLICGYLIDVTQDNAYLVMDTGCGYSGSYFSCDQHLIKADCR